MWDFEKLPPGDYHLVLEYWANQDFIKLMALYNSHQIPPTNLTACCAWAAIAVWSEYAIEHIINPTLRGNSGEVLQQDSANGG